MRVCRSLALDKEVRKLRESAPQTVRAAAIRSVLQECAAQQQRYEQRRSTGTLISSWLVTPRASIIGSGFVGAGSVQGATSLAQPCLDTGSELDGMHLHRLSPVQEQAVDAC